MNAGAPMAAMIEAAGGLATSAELAKRWGVSRQRGREIVAHPDFPAPVAEVSGRKVYAIAEADDWRAQERPAGRPKTTGDISSALKHPKLQP
jgi:hypothetical protein